MEMLASGLIGKAEEVFGHGFDSGTSPVGACGIKEILAKVWASQCFWQPLGTNQAALGDSTCASLIMLVG